jgi:hypothetical protein
MKKKTNDAQYDFFQCKFGGGILTPWLLSWVITTSSCAECFWRFFLGWWLKIYKQIIFWSIPDAPWYVSNHTIHTNQIIPFIFDLIKTRFQQFHSKLSIHPNPLAQTLPSPYHPLYPRRRLNRQWPRDLLWVPKDCRKCHWWVASSLSPPYHILYI